MTDQAYRVESSERIYDGRVISLRRDHVRMSDGAVADREIVEHPGAVGVVAVDDDGRVLLVQQYRHPVRERLDELPAGLLDVDGEPALEAAQRELAEEAATLADDWHVLVDLHTSPGMTDEAIRIFLARGLRPVPEHERFDPEHEEIELTVERVPLDEAVRRVFAGELTNAAAIAGVLAAAHAAQHDWAGVRPADAPWPARPDRVR
jgi:8-oxo-dGTP pyrophosphatase MutT (NUDIX family)